MWSIFTNEAEGYSVGSDQNHAQTHKCRILAAGIAKCSQQTSSFQVRLGQAAWVALPSAHHGKILTYWATILQLSRSGRQSRSTL
jgi:hypothetical protein